MVSLNHFLTYAILLCWTYSILIPTRLDVSYQRQHRGWKARWACDPDNWRWDVSMTCHDVSRTTVTYPRQQTCCHWCQMTYSHWTSSVSILSQRHKEYSIRHKTVSRALPVSAFFILRSYTAWRKVICTQKIHSYVILAANTPTLRQQWQFLATSSVAERSICLSAKLRVPRAICSRIMALLGYAQFSEPAGLYSQSMDRQLIYDVDTYCQSNEQGHFQ